MSNLEIEDVEREMETEKELAEAESKEEGDKKEDQKEEEMELPPIVEGIVMFRPCSLVSALQ